MTLEALTPEETARRNEAEAAEHQKELDKEELADLERAQTGGVAHRRPSILDRLMRRRYGP
jgi:hypothetical protein